MGSRPARIGRLSKINDTDFEELMKVAKQNVNKPVRFLPGSSSVAPKPKPKAAPPAESPKKPNVVEVVMSEKKYGEKWSDLNKRVSAFKMKQEQQQKQHQQPVTPQCPEPAQQSAAPHRQNARLPVASQRPQQVRASTASQQSKPPMATQQSRPPAATQRPQQVRPTATSRRPQQAQPPSGKARPPAAPSMNSPYSAQVRYASPHGNSNSLGRHPVINNSANSRSLHRPTNLSMMGGRHMGEYSTRAPLSMGRAYRPQYNEEDDYEEDGFVVDEDDDEAQDELRKTLKSVFRYDKRRCDRREEELDREYRAIGRVSTFEDLEREERRAARLAAAEDAKAQKEEDERKRLKKIRLQKGK